MNVRFARVEPERALIVDFRKFTCFIPHGSLRVLEIWALTAEHARAAYAEWAGVPVTRVETMLT